MSGETGAKARLLARIDNEREQWQRLVAEVGLDHMEEPGPMGNWSFKNLAAHLTGWRERTLALLDAGPGQEAQFPWPAELIDDDAVNQWLYERDHDRTPDDILLAADNSFARLASAIRALPEEDLITPGRFPWLGAEPLADADFFGHLHEEHEADVRRWLAERDSAR